MQAVHRSLQPPAEIYEEDVAPDTFAPALPRLDGRRRRRVQFKGKYVCTLLTSAHISLRPYREIQRLNALSQFGFVIDDRAGGLLILITY